MAAVAFFILLGHKPLADWDEAIYADIAREFVYGPSRIVPHWNFQPWLERTPLFEWITAGFFAVFGVTEFWARAGAALTGIATIACVYSLGKRNGFLAALILISTNGYLYEARFGTTDALLTLWMTVSLLGLVRVTDGQSKGWLLWWIGLALGVMTKSAGPAPLVLATLVVCGVTWRLISINNRCFWIGALLFVAIVAPWHVYMFAHYGRQFFDDYIGRQILERSTKSLEGHRGTPLFYVIRIAKGAFPWSLLLIPAALRIWRERRFTVIEWYAVIVFLFYTVVKTKLPWYILPAYPAIAEIAAGELQRLWPRFSKPLCAAACVVVAGVYLWLELRQPYDRPELMMLKNHPSAAGRDLILCSDAFIQDAPAAVFYGHRRVVQAYVAQFPHKTELNDPFDPATNDPKFRNPRPLETYVSATPELLLIDKRLLGSVAARYHLDLIDEDSRFALATIRSRF